MKSLKESGVSREIIYDGAVLRVVKDEVTLPNGKGAVREFCMHIGAVCVIPVLDDGRVIMERQYRYPHSREFFEIPAGKLDFVGEDPLTAAKRELREETGGVAESYTFLGELDTTPAITDEKIHMYLAEGITFGDRELDEDEFINVELLPLAELYRMVMAGEIKDAKTQIAVLKVWQIREKYRNM
ncbi:MAG: NUDIX hydrolase [Clostridia bacterium]|nr:NUDIX hydrolase [Clostridia bacterium]MBQ8720117.1 NUDIX hydrolase [Clostridia bacterium]